MIGSFATLKRAARQVREQARRMGTRLSAALLVEGVAPG